MHLLEVPGALQIGQLAYAPHVADPRLPTMRCGWQPFRTPFCGRLGKVIDVNPCSVKLYSCGKELWWDIELFDSRLARYCHRGCTLERQVVCKGYICDVCLSRVPLGAKVHHCNKHDYGICSYCLGIHTPLAVGSSVIRGPTWPAELPIPGGQDYYEEGIVETAFLDGIDHIDPIHDVDVPSHYCRYQIYWAKNGTRSYCRGPPFQDVTPYFSNDLIGEKPLTEADRTLLTVRAQLQDMLRGSFTLCSSVVENDIVHVSQRVDESRVCFTSRKEQVICMNQLANGIVSGCLIGIQSLFKLWCLTTPPPVVKPVKSDFSRKYF